MVSFVERALVGWLDLASATLGGQLFEDPLRGVCERINADLPGSFSVTPELGPHRKRIRLHSPVPSPQRGVEFYERHMLDYPLLRYFRATGDTTVRPLSHARDFRRDAASERVMRCVEEEEGIRDSVCMPLPPTAAGAARWLVAGRFDKYTSEELLLCTRVHGLVIGLVRHAAVMQAWRRAHQPSAEALAVAEDEARLTARELAVLSLVADGLTAQAVGRHLVISERTVTKHLEHIYRKLGARDRVTAVLRAQAMGLLSENMASSVSIGRSAEC